MAQAPQGPSSGAPRLNKTVKEFGGMNTQNERNALRPGTFHWLENIQPIGPGNLHSIPGRSSAVVRIPPAPIPGACTDTTLRGQQLLEILVYFINNHSPGGNDRTSWAFIDDDETIQTAIGYSACAGGNMVYSDICMRLNNFVGGGNPVSTSALPIEQPLLPFINTRVGVADRVAWGAMINPGFVMFYDGGLTQVTYTIPTDGFGSLSVQAYAVKENRLWIASNRDGVLHLLEFDRLFGGAALNDFTPWGAVNDSAGNMQLTDDFLYLLKTSGTVVTIEKLNIPGATVADSFDITNINANFLAVASDDLIYILCNGNPEASLLYLENFTDVRWVGVTTGQGITPFGLGTGIWKDGSFYYGSNGFGGFSCDIQKISVACPPSSGPLIVSVVMGAATVAAGSSIDVTWDDVLVPTVGDYFIIRPAPGANELGYEPQAYQVATGGASGGTIPFLVPMATAPGTYVLMYVHANGVYVATSNTFTVT